MFGFELRASAAPRLRPAWSFQGRNSKFGTQLAKDRHERTCGREERAFAGRSCGPLRPAGTNSKFKIQNCRSDCSLRRARSKRTCGTRAVGLRRPQAAGCGAHSGAIHDSKLPEASMLGRFECQASPQPSGRACDVKEQPSARGRLRAANRYAIEFAGNHLNQTRRAAARRCPTASPRPCKKYGPGNDPNGQKPAESAAGFFSGIVFDLFPDSCGSATAVRFLHLFKFGLVVLEGAIPSGAAGSREDSLLFFLRTGPTAATLPLHHPPEPATRPDAAAKNNPAKTAAKNSPRK